MQKKKSHDAKKRDFTIISAASRYVSHVSDWTATSLFINVSVFYTPKSISKYEYHAK